MSKHAFIGVDLGGTSIKVGLFLTVGKLHDKYKGPTEGYKGMQQMIGNIYHYVTELLRRNRLNWKDVAGVGVGIAGFVQADAGRLDSSPNLGITNVAIRKQLERKLRVPVAIDNDANVAALGEATAGAGSGKQHVVCYTLGTGVGGGVVIDGHIYRGRGYAGEFGHMQVVPDIEAISCRCGQLGCLETVASATGIRKMAMEIAERGEQSELSVQEYISVKNVFQAAENGDAAALRIVRRAAHYLAKSMATVTVAFDPQRIIVGGGVSHAGDLLLQPLRKAYNEQVIEPFKGRVDIVIAKLGNDAGMIGASLLIASQLKGVD